MPCFNDSTTSAAPPEEVWKLLYDPARFPEWWTGVGTVEVSAEDSYTMYPEGYPDFPMPQQLRVSGSGVTISCLVSDLIFEWRLAPLDGGAATSITVHVEVPEAEAHRLTAQQDAIGESLSRLAVLAAAESRLRFEVRDG
jgi:Polyketide cyclase / dehydrase and lipid transport